MATDSILATLAAFSTSLTFKDLPATAVAAARDRLLDAIACAIGAYDCDTAEAGRVLAGAAASPQWAGCLLGSKKLAAADAAAFVNTCMIRNLDLNDIIQGGHPSDSLGALLAVAPQSGADDAAVAGTVDTGCAVAGAGGARTALSGQTHPLHRALSCWRRC